MFTGRDIRILRQRLGWSVAELARRMECGVEVIQKWESNDSQPDPQALNQLNYLLNRVETYHEQIHQQPIAEKEMEERRMAQLTSRDLLNDIQ